MSWRDTVSRVFRVPPDPEPPQGTPPRIFRAAKNYFTLKVIGFALGQLVAFGTAIAFTGVLVLLARDGRVGEWTVFWIRVGEVIAWALLIAQLFFSWAVMRLDYELRWYMVSDRAIRIREGIAFVREKTMTLANIQHISIRQGPLQRLLGIADVEVRTAGGGSGTTQDGKQNPLLEPGHVAYFRGVDNATEIRDLVRDGVRRQKGTGLGDLDDDVEPAAVAELLGEARELRALCARFARLDS